MIPFNKPHLTGKEAHYMYKAVYALTFELYPLSIQKILHLTRFICTGLTKIQLQESR